MAIQAQLYSHNSFWCPMEYSDANLCKNIMHFDHTNTNEYDHHTLYHHSSTQPQPQQSYTFSQTVSAHIETQRLEFQHLINLQNERLRYAIEEESKQHISGFLRSYESRARFLLAQKDEEIAMAAGRTAELQEFLRNLEIEGLTWQRIARENESMAASLTGTIQRMKRDRDYDDAESRVEGAVPRRCRRCESREARVVLLPCRHLCSCGECDVFIDTCPVCMTGKRGSIAVEAFV